jgi:hypothetical protein
MRPPCPRCRKSEFAYRALLAVHPYAGESSPARITCPSCGEALRVTAKSRLFAVCAVSGSLLGSIFLLGTLPVDLPKWQTIFLALCIALAYYLAIWPVIVRLKPWTPFQYWLPKRRVVGYSVYLLFPVALMAVGLYLLIAYG